MFVATFLLCAISCLGSIPERLAKADYSGIDGDNVCLTALTELVSTEEGFNKLTFAGMHSSTVNDLVIGEILGSSESATVLGNKDGCNDLGTDFHFCYQAPLTKISLFEPTFRNAICLPTACDTFTLYNPEILGGLQQLFMVFLNEFQQTCNTTALTAAFVYDNEHPDRNFKDVLGPLKGCIKAERVLDYIISVLNLPLPILENPKNASGLACGNEDTVADNRKIKPHNAAVIAIFVIFAMIVVAASLFWWHLERQRELREQELEYGLLDAGAEPETSLQIVAGYFCLQNTFTDLFYTPERLKQSKSYFSSLDGIRALSMFWVIFGHSIVWVQFYYGFLSTEHVFPPNGFYSQFTGQVFVQNPLAVDTFFFLSGFLATWLCIRKLSPKDGDNIVTASAKLPWIFVNRWLRLVIPMFFVMLFRVGVLELLANPFPSSSLVANACKYEKFLYNLLYIVDDTGEPQGQFSSDICIGMTWYLQIDMRVFIFIPFLAIMYHYINKHLALFSAVVAFIVSFIIRAAYMIHHNASPNATDGDASDAYGNMYGHAEYRYGVMVVGMILAIVWDMYLKDMGKFSTCQAWTLFCLMVIFMMTSVYGEWSGNDVDSFCQGPIHSDCGSGWSKTQRVLFGTTNRCVWALGLTCMCLLCFKHQFPLVDWLMSHDFIKPFSRLSFLMYLCQEDMFTLFYINDGRRQRYHYLWFVKTFLGCLCSCFLISIFYHCVFEKPFANMQKAAMARLMGSGGSKIDYIKPSKKQSSGRSSQMSGLVNEHDRGEGQTTRTK